MTWGPRKALVKVGNPVDLRDYFSSDKTDKRGVVQEVALAIESQVRRMLAALAEHARQTSVERSPFEDGPDEKTR